MWLSATKIGEHKNNVQFWYREGKCAYSPVPMVGARGVRIRSAAWPAGTNKGGIVSTA